MASCGHGSIYPTVLAAAISDLEDMAAACGYREPDWITITPFSLRFAVPRQTLINRLGAWFDHHRRRNTEPWSEPLSCPIYRHGRWPRTPRQGSKQGFWLLDAGREAEIRRELRNFSRLSRAERVRINLPAGFKNSRDIHQEFEMWRRSQKLG